MTRKATYVTERHTSAWFRGRLEALFRAADVDVTITREKQPDDPYPVISGSWRAYPGIKIAVMPFNEPLLPIEPPDQQGGRWNDYVLFFVSQASHLLEHLVAQHMRPSATVDHPLCACPVGAEPEDNRPMKFIVPCYGDWTPDLIVQFLPYLVAALGKDFGDLSNCEFVVEAPPFEYRTALGEKVTFYDDEGHFLGRLLRSTAVCCMAPSCLMEMSFLARMTPTTNTLLFSEGLMDAGTRSTPQSVMQAFARPSKYSHVKYQRAASGVIQLDDPDMSPLFSFCSGSRTKTETSTVIAPRQINTLMGLAAGRSRNNIDAAILAEQQSHFDTMVQKITALVQRLDP